VYLTTTKLIPAPSKSILEHQGNIRKVTQEAAMTTSLPRAELSAKLETLAPALLPDAVVPALGMVWFLGDRAMAYNDVISISVPLETKFTGAVPGLTLIKVIKASLAKTVEVLPGKNSIEVKAARTRLKLALSDPETFAFTMPEVKNYTGLDFDHGRSFIQALDHLMLSVGDDPLQPDQCGVTLIQAGDDTLLYATNRSTISHAKLHGFNFLQDGERVILPTAFCQQMITFMESESMGLCIDQDQGHACFHAGEVKVWGRLLASKDPLDFVGVAGNFLPEDITLFPVPKNLNRTVDRILVVADDKELSMTMSVRNSRCHFELSSAHGEIFDSVPLPDHPEASAMIKPKWVKPVCHFDEMLLTARCLIMRKDNATYMVSTGTPKET
jgi:hypothetical protein